MSAAGASLSDSETAQLRRATRDGLAVGVATAAYGVSFGALSVAAGLDVWQTCVLSLLMFTGGSQFALVGVIAAGGVAAGPSAILSAGLLGARNALYGIRMKPLLEGGFWRRVAAAWLTIDESTAVGTAGTTPRSRSRGFWVTGLAVYVGWNLATLAGALLGDALGDVSAYGLDAAAAAAFLGLLWPRLTRLQPVVVAIAAAVVATALTPWLAPGLPVLCAAAVGIVVGIASRSRALPDAGIVPVDGPPPPVHASHASSRTHHERPAPPVDASRAPSWPHRERPVADAPSRPEPGAVAGSDAQTAGDAVSDPEPGADAASAPRTGADAALAPRTDHVPPGSSDASEGAVGSGTPEGGPR